MPYKPDIIAEAERLSTADLVQYLSRELEKISQAITPIEQGRLQVLYVEPPKKRQGMVVYADGTTWNPGTGAGLYTYTGSEWLRLVPEKKGTWTPDLQFGGGKVGITYATQTGEYVQHGKLVNFWARITLTNKGVSVGQAAIAGLPVIAAQNSPFQMGFCLNMGAANTGFGGYINNTSLTLLAIAAGNIIGLTNADFTNTSDLIVGGTYHIA